MPLTSATPLSIYIKDFIKSDDPRFAGDSKKKRIERATAAYYAKQNEEIESLEELSNDTLTSYKKGAIADVTSADKVGNTAKADKRVAGITKATGKQDDKGDYAKTYANTYKKSYDIAHGERGQAHAFVDADESKANAKKYQNDAYPKNESLDESGEKKAKHVADVISAINTATPATKAKHLAYLKGIMNKDDYAHIKHQLRNEGIEMEMEMEIEEEVVNEIFGFGEKKIGEHQQSPQHEHLTSVGYKPTATSTHTTYEHPNGSSVSYSHNARNGDSGNHYVHDADGKNKTYNNVRAGDDQLKTFRKHVSLNSSGMKEEVIPTAHELFFDAIQGDKLSEAKECLENILAEKISWKIMELKEAIAKKRGAADFKEGE
jgi:hypothetical protein